MDAGAPRNRDREPASAIPLTTVFLDRDGVINRKPADGAYVARWSEFAFLPGVPDAISRLTEAGLRVVVVTNQRGIARGLVKKREVERIHRRMIAALAESGARIAAVYYCPHEEGECDCRKPATGLFQQARRDDPRIDFAASVVVGDSWRDVQAGNAIGSRTILIESDPLEAQGAAVKAAGLGLVLDVVAGSLAEAVDWVLART